MQPKRPCCFKRSRDAENVVRPSNTPAANAAMAQSRAGEEQKGPAQQPRGRGQARRGLRDRLSCDGGGHVPDVRSQGGRSGVSAAAHLCVGSNGVGDGGRDRRRERSVRADRARAARTARRDSRNRRRRAPRRQRARAAQPRREVRADAARARPVAEDALLPPADGVRGVHARPTRRSAKRSVEKSRGGFVAAGSDAGSHRLRIRPSVADLQNAFYDRTRGELVSASSTPRPAWRVATSPAGGSRLCLSHDVVVHEMSHALLDGMRSHFLVAVESRRACVPRSLRRSDRDLPAVHLSRRGVDGDSRGARQRIRRDAAHEHRSCSSRRRWTLPAHCGPRSPAPTIATRTRSSRIIAAKCWSLAVFEAFASVYHRKTDAAHQAGHRRQRRAVPGDIPDWTRRTAHRLARASWRRSFSRSAFARSTTVRRSTSRSASTSAR